MLIWCDVNEKIAVAGLIWGRKKHQGRSWTGSIPALNEQRIHEEHPYITVSWQQQWATSGSLLEICKYLDRAPNCEPVVVTVWFGKLVPLKITGWSFAHHPFQTTTHYPDFTQFKQLQKGDPPLPPKYRPKYKICFVSRFLVLDQFGFGDPICRPGQ